MQLVSQNPYHILGLVAGTNQRTVEKQKGKINAYQKVGKDIGFDDDLIAIGKPERSNGSIEKAFSNIEINQSKLFHSLFWFVNTNHLDEIALNYLKSNDLSKAEDIWKKIVTGKSISDKNIGAYNNLGTLKLLTSTLNDPDTAELLEAIKLKTELITSEYFTQFCHRVIDETYTTNVDQELHRFINAILGEAKSIGYSDTKRLPGMIAEAHPSLKTIVSDKVADEPFHNIEFILEQTKKKRTANPETGFALAKKLYTATKDDFTTLADILGKSDPKFKLVADKLAKEILQCGIDYFQEFREHEDQHNGDLGNDIMKLFKYAKSIAVGMQTKDRIEQNIEGLQEWIDSATDRERQELVKNELNYISHELEAFQSKPDSVSNAETLLNACKPKLLTIKNTLGQHDELYLNISSAVVRNVQGMLVAVINKEQDDMSRKLGFVPGEFEFIRNKIDKAYLIMQDLNSFDMVPELRQQFSSNKSALTSIYNQFKTAQENVKARSTNNSGGNCYIATMAYGSYEHPQVIELRKFRDTILSKYQIGKLFIKLYYKYSPRLVNAFENSQFVNKAFRVFLNLFIRIIK